MGRASFNKGGVHAQNLQAKSVDVTVDANGDGSATLTFDTAMKSTPKIVATIAEAVTTENLWITSQTNASCSVGIDGASTTGDTITVDVIAFDDSYN